MGVDGSSSNLKEENLKLEALLLNSEIELKLLKDKIKYLIQYYQKNNSNYFSNSNYIKKFLSCVKSEAHKEEKKEEKSRVKDQLS